MNKRRTKSSSSNDSMKKLRRDREDVLKGKLTARSHILNSKPKCVILEICTRRTACYILVDGQFHLKLNNLNIGKDYKFFNLCRGSILVKDKAVECFSFREETIWEELEELEDHEIQFYQTSSEPLTTIQGTVTTVDKELGLCCLDDTKTIIISTCLASVPFPKQGQDIIVYNAHCVDVGNEQVVYTMCVRSFLLICNEINSSGLRTPMLDPLGDTPRSYKIILWLKDCFSFLKESFADDFLISNGISISECDNFRSTLLQNIARSAAMRFRTQRESSFFEFMTHRHNAVCGTLKQEPAPHSLLTLNEILKARPDLVREETEVDLESNDCENIWDCDIKQSDYTKPIIGVMSVKNSCKRLTLSDSNGFAYCLVLTRGDQNLSGEDLSRFNRKVVITWEYDIIREKFYLETPETSPSYLVLGAYNEATDVISDFGKSWKTHKCQQITIYNKCISNPGPSSQEDYARALGLIEEPSPTASSSCVSPLINPCLNVYKSQLVYIQTKSSITYVSAKNFRFYCLVTLLGKMNLVHPSLCSDFKWDKTEKKSVFLSFETPFIPAHPFIAVNSIYEIRLPVQCEEDYFQKGTTLSSIEALNYTLPTVMSITLPKGSEVHIVTNHLLPNINSKFRDCYRINQAVKEATSNELINIVGYVTGRFHQNAKFEREKKKVFANGIGIPGTKVVALILRDTPVAVQTSIPFTLYLTYWNQNQYPVGLVPGCKVIFRFVMKIIPKNSSPAPTIYFRSSILTSVEILEVSNNKERKESWGSRSLLSSNIDAEASNCKWLSVSMTDLHRVGIKATCSACQHEIVKGVCSFVGCSAPLNTLLYCQASFFLSDLHAHRTLVFVPNALVQKIFKASEKIWKMVKILAQSCGQLKFYQFDSLEDISRRPIEERIFHSFCKSRISGERFHMLCRPYYRKDIDEACEDLATLYALDIVPVSPQIASS